MAPRDLEAVGRLVAIGTAATPGAPIQSHAACEVITDRGLVGDHNAAADSTRQVTLIQVEHLAEAAALLGLEKVPSSATRRNLATSGIDLLALIGQHFAIGEVEFLATGPCRPCSRMETSVARGALAALAGRGGITARVVRGGHIAVGDEVRAVATAP